MMSGTRFGTVRGFREVKKVDDQCLLSGYDVFDLSSTRFQLRFR